MTTNRIYQGEDEQWYFHVRGNQAAGPFATQQEAAGALSKHVKVCQRRTEFTLGWPRAWSPTRLLRRTTSTARHI